MGSLRGTTRVPSYSSSVCLTVLCALMPLAAYAQQPSAAATAAPAAQPSPRQIRTAEKAYAQGVRAMQKGDVDAAEKAFAKALKADPSNREYALDLQIANQHRVTKLVQDADKARLTGQPDVARAKLAEALALDPQNSEVSQHIYDLAKLASTASPDDSLNATFAPPIELTPKPGKQSFHFRSTEQEVLRRVL
jgi:general secretion pathway protein D